MGADGGGGEVGLSLSEEPEQGNYMKILPASGPLFPAYVLLEARATTSQPGSTPTCRVHIQAGELSTTTGPPATQGSPQEEASPLFLCSYGWAWHLQEGLWSS